MSVVSRPIPVIRPGGYAELAAEIRELGLMNRRPGYYAGLLGITEGTVKNHITDIFRALNATNRTQAAQHGLGAAE